MYNQNEYLYANLSSAATTQVATGKGILHTVVINTVDKADGTIKLIDGTAGTTANMATITMTGSAYTTLRYDTVFATGLRIVTSTSPNITVTYTQG